MYSEFEFTPKLLFKLDLRTYRHCVLLNILSVFLFFYFFILVIENTSWSVNVITHKINLNELFQTHKRRLIGIILDIFSINK